MLRVGSVGDSLQIREQWWNDTDRGKAELLAGELVTVSLWLPQFSMEWPRISRNHHPYPKGNSFSSSSNKNDDDNDDGDYDDDENDDDDGGDYDDFFLCFADRESQYICLSN